MSASQTYSSSELSSPHLGAGSLPAPALPHYDTMSRWLHWTTAALILIALPIGL